MTSTIRDSLSSEPFEILAQSGKRFYVHSNILAAQSEPLRSATTGVWKEASEKKIDLSDWDDDTVCRFVEFLYFGDYRVTELTSEDKNIGGEAEREKNGWFGTNLLLIHARVYALAHYKDVVDLKMMALGRLKTELERIDGPMLKDTSTVTGTANVIELLGYVYSHTDSLTNSEEPMREIVSTFAAKNLETLVIRGEMALLLREKCDFSVDLMEKAAARFRASEKKSCEMEVISGDLRDKVEMLEGIEKQMVDLGNQKADLKKQTVDLKEENSVLNLELAQLRLSATSVENTRLVAENQRMQRLRTSNLERVQGLQTELKDLKSQLSQSKTKLSVLELSHPEKNREYQKWKECRSTMHTALAKLDLPFPYA